MLVGKKTVFLSLVSAALVLIGGTLASFPSVFWVYQPRTPKAFRSK